MADVGPVQGEGVRPRLDREGGPRRQPEVRVDDVERIAAVSSPQLARRADVRAGAAWREGEDLDVHAFEVTQRVHLVAHEAAECGVGRGRPHVRDDQGAHP